MLGCGLLGCTAHVFSPPGGAFVLDTARTLGEGRTSVRAEGFYGGGVFGPSVRSHRVTVAHGVHEKLNVQIAPAFSQIHPRQRGDSRGEIYALSLGAKYAPVEHFAVVTGLAAGYSAAGAFVSPSFNLIGAYENRYVVPFVSTGMFLSAPMAVRSVHFRVDEDSNAVADRDPDSDRVLLKPVFTYGVQTGVGARIWLDHDPSAVRRPSLLAGLGWTLLSDRYGWRHRDAYFGGSIAVEMQF